MKSKLIKKNNKKKGLIVNLILIALVIVLALIPLITLKDAEFAGADGKAEIAINEIDKEYTPWFSPLFEPKSGEVESLLFSLQAAIGAGVIGYGLGYLRGRSKKEVKDN